MTTDVPLLIDIQNACQLAAGKSGRKIKRFPADQNPPVRAPRRQPAEILATPMISCAQHRRPRWRSRNRI
ncbi:hypothetical protein ACVIWU_003158 [Bradyrhizobium sp. USDA 4509]|uniref:Uncharacterized protein n=1 Tax=Bradyrhizobium brasilense TaxID=1419277 RepID=A0ABY8JTZ4_9BRAD|nr:hypothetical protein [Bradyrhizobium brasilense]WFU67468.1 hypothetical protein QA636_19060 [Bradyrhizobium brasilense]